MERRKITTQLLIKIKSMKTKIFYGNQFVGKFNCDGKRYTRGQRLAMALKRLVVRTLMVMAILSSLGWAMYAGSAFMPVTVYAEKEVVKEVEAQAPILKRIAKCESSDMHFKDGQVLVRPNTNGTVDIGRYQINSVWNKKATELGLDLTKEVDNEKMARWIYSNRGTGDWSASAKCWAK